MTADALWSLIAMPLTPIHVGDGTVLTPDEWRLGEAGLERFSASAVLHGLGAAARQRYLAELDQGRLIEAQRLLREAVRTDHIRERIAVTTGSAAELRQVIDNPMRRGDVRPFARSGYRPYIPGSSIKGAIRTALLSALAEASRPELAHRMQDLAGEKSGRRQDELQKAVLEAHKPDRDPLRFIQVADCSLPAGATRIDKVENWRPTRQHQAHENDARGGIQMHFERLVSRADDGPSPRFEVEIAVRAGRLAEARRADRTGERVPRRDLEPRQVWSMVNDFYWRRFDTERQRFFEDEAGTLEVLRKATTFRQNGREIDESTLRLGHPFLLLRLGRFGQFESKSVDGYREGWNIQARRAMKEGHTRNVIRVQRPQASGHLIQRLLPMGWLLLMARSR